MSPAVTTPVPHRHSNELARASLVLGSVALSVVWVLWLRDRAWSDGHTAVWLNDIQLALYAGYIACTRDQTITRLLVFGACFGVVELAADALCVQYTHTLDYSVAHSGLLGFSPWWMPCAWMIVAGQIGYLGMLLMRQCGDRIGVTLTALLGAVNIPFYEEMAFHAHWWRYERCRMIGHTPVYIIVAELLIGLTLGPLARVAVQGPGWLGAAAAGLIGGVGTIFAGLFGYGLVERIF